ncbi:MAG: hypothetical protein IJT65_02120 [Eubacterium sp.]|nr:hypothetical protein [Eubacterium sp.]
MKEVIYSGYNPATCNKICDYLKEQGIKYGIKAKVPSVPLAHAETVIKVKKDDLTEVNRMYIQKIVDSSPDL